MRKLILMLFILSLAISAWGGAVYNPYTGKFDIIPDVQEEDGTPYLSACQVYKFPNDTVTDNSDGTCSISSGQSNPAQVIVVAKSNGDYATITSALNSITDATTNKRYVILVYPGIYDEAVTMKSWIDIVGIDFQTCRIVHSTGGGVVFSANDSQLRNLYIQNTNAYWQGTCIELENTTNTFEIHNSYLYKESSNNLVIVVGDANGAQIRPVKIYNSTVYGKVINANTDSCQPLYKIGDCEIKNSYIKGEGSDINGVLSLQFQTGTQNIYNSVIEIDSTDTNVAGFYGTDIVNIYNSSFKVSGGTNNYLGSLDTAEINLYGVNSTLIFTGLTGSTITYSHIGKIILSIDADTIADSGNGNAATHTLQPSTSYVNLTCNDVDTCDITMSETGAIDGQTVRIGNVSANICDFSDTAGVSELAGAFAMGQWDTLELMYTTDRWVEMSRSGN